VDTKFWNNLVKGNEGESIVKHHLEDRGFNVWGIGQYRLPVDLLVWDKDVSFWIQVKLRTESIFKLEFTDEEEEAISKRREPILIVLVYLDKLYFDYGIRGTQLSKDKIEKTGLIWTANLTTRNTKIEKIEGYKSRIRNNIADIEVCARQLKRLEEDDRDII
jgi:hypothetical protein